MHASSRAIPASVYSRGVLTTDGWIDAQLAASVSYQDRKPCAGNTEGSGVAVQCLRMSLIDSRSRWVTRTIAPSIDDPEDDAPVDLGSRETGLQCSRRAIGELGDFIVIRAAVLDAAELDGNERGGNSAIKFVPFGEDRRARELPVHCMRQHAIRTSAEIPACGQLSLGAT